MALFKNFDVDYYEEPSDEDDYDDSSDDEEDPFKFLMRIADNKPKEDFESEMNSELNDAVASHESKHHFAPVTSKGSTNAGEKSGTSNDQEKKYYDEIYFDSSDEDEPSKKKSKKVVLTNDELFYDPDMDNEDQKWVDNQRRNYLKRNNANFTSKDPLPKSDAVLNCPACMTTLCMDCQRHDIYSTQYRAVFARNCSVNFGESLHYPLKTKKFKKKKPESPPDPSTIPASEMYHPVTCNVCKTEVAVYDCDEVYHFFNVLTGC